MTKSTLEQRTESVRRIDSELGSSLEVSTSRFSRQRKVRNRGDKLAPRRGTNARGTHSSISGALRLMQTNRYSLSTPTSLRSALRWAPCSTLLLALMVGCGGDGPASGDLQGSTNTGGSAAAQTGAQSSSAGTTSGGPAGGTGAQTTGAPATGGTGTLAGASSGTVMGGTGGTDMTCPLPSTFQWTSTGPLAEPTNSGATSLKDFSVTHHDGNYVVYGTTADGNWNGFASTFSSFDQWAAAEQHYIPGLVAPTIFYFTPKDTWVLAYQWGFKYATSKTPDDPNSWSRTQSLLDGDPTGGRGTGPIDQTVICDDSNCFLFFNDDAGGVYRGSMPVSEFPGAFSNATRIMDQPTSVIF